MVELHVRLRGHNILDHIISRIRMLALQTLDAILRGETLVEETFAGIDVSAGLEDLPCGLRTTG